MVVELIGAFVSGSLALAAESVHMASGVAALGVALLALRLTRRSSTARYTYGWHRAETLLTVIAGTVIGMSAFTAA